MPELPNKPKEPILFAAVPFKCEDDEVFVELHPSNTEMAFEYERKKQSELTPGDEVIKCIICGKPASQIDHHFPWEIHDNRCKQHRHSLIDEYVYDQYGCGVEVCKDHYRVLSLVSSMTSVADWLMKHPENPDAEPLRQKMIAFKQELDRFMAKQWPEELFGPKNEAKEPDKTLGGTHMIALQFIGGNASYISDAIGGASVAIPSFGIMQLQYKHVNYTLHYGDVVVRHFDGALEIMTEHDFHHKYPLLPLETAPKADTEVGKYIFYTGDNDREVWAVAGIDLYEIEPMPYGMRMYHKNGFTCDVFANTVVFIKKGSDIVQSLKPEKFREKYPTLTIATEAKK